jgi:hypothetical protein
MFVPPRLPFILPKFCIHLYILSPVTQPYSSIVTRCYVPGDDKPFAEEPIDTPSREEQRRLLAESKDNPEAPRNIVVSASLIFTPLEIQGPGLISVGATIDGEPELKLGALRVLTKDR